MLSLNKWLVLMVIGFTTLSSSPVNAASVEEAWFLMRSRANMKIGNFAAAIEAYEKYLELKPDDREALKGIAVAYEKQGQTDKAIARYDNYLKVYRDDPDTAFKQANYLMWERYAYRKPDAINYFQMGLEKKDDPDERRKLARLLAEDKFDLDRAVKQYSRLVQQDPANEELRAEFRNVLLWEDRFLDQAIEQFEYFVQRNPNDFNARKQLAELLAKTRDRRNDAIAIYAQLVSKRPKDLALRHDYARLLAKTPGHFAEARAQYQALLARQPDNEILLETALLLESNEKTRDDAIPLYSRILKRQPGDNATRMRRAAVYMDTQATAPMALEDYRAVIKRNPRHADAHAGAAEALAWLDQPDDALYHAGLARKYKGGNRTQKLYQRLSKGREPGVTAFIELPKHKGGDYKLDGVVLGASLSGELSPYFSAHIDFGSERYDGNSDDASDTWWMFGGEYRLNTQQRINFTVEDHGIRRVGDTSGFQLTFTDSKRFEPWTFSVGYDQRLVADSFLSLVGDGVNNIGGATSDELFTVFVQADESRQITFKASVGAVESASESSNSFINLFGSVHYKTSLLSWVDEAHLGADIALMSYSKDHSGFGVSATEPLSGGYFSPQSFASTLFYLYFVEALDEDTELQVKVGPKLQYVNDASEDGETSSGFSATLSYQIRQSKSRFLTFKGEFDKIGNRYDRLLLGGQVMFVF